MKNNLLHSFFKKLRFKGYTNNFRRREECETLIGWLGACRGERILDIGCGNGDLDYRISKTGAYVVGIDVNRDTLAVANAANVTDRTEFLHMNAQTLDFPDRSFDKAISFCVIEHFEHEDKALSEIARVLKPGGLFVFSADSLSNPEVTGEERALHRTRYSVNTFYTRESAIRKLHSAGFDVVRARYILTHPISLWLARMTWKMDDLRQGTDFVADAGHFVANFLGLTVANLAEKVGRREDSGLTLLVMARKR
ncbi:MAG: methyltransferase domain-containing protein [Myxococcales bacterium]|nr:methyltransferase domain-containing protein [Myxococcales bacterium]